MAGIIKREDIEEVRSRARIDDIVGEYVQLRSAGADSLKGLCPFHDERTPSFHVRPSMGYWHCFGCGEGGDVIDFIMRINHLEFIDAVEYLAGKVGVQLRYEKGQRRGDASESSLRRKVAQAHEVAEHFYSQQLFSPQGRDAKEYLHERGFDDDAIRHFGLGYSPQGWDSLLHHLRSRGFTEYELKESGLMSSGQRGLYDRFRGRLMWPIRDITGQTVGFGARRLSDDDNGPKYLNTPETVLYKKSRVLYGLDLAKKTISRQRQVIVVEGYTDVMAMHLAGLTNAVATCGTAFGAEHVQIIRRLLGDRDDASVGVMLSSGKARGGQVIFTFDGDEAGRKAALKAFQEDQKFAAQTFVCVEPSGKDPCDVRLAEGDAGLQRLISLKQPLFAFVIRTILKSLDLSTAEGRVMGMRQTAPIVLGIKDVALRQEYIRQLAGWLSMPVEQINAELRQAMRSRNRRPEQPRVTPPTQSGDVVYRTEAQALEALLQRPFDVMDLDIDGGDLFVTPQWKAIGDVIRSIGGMKHFEALLSQAKQYIPDPAQAQRAAVTRFGEEILQATPKPLESVVRGLIVAPLPQDDPTELQAYCQGVVKAVMKMALTRRIANLRGQQQLHDGPEKQRIFQQILELEAQKRALGEPT